MKHIVQNSKKVLLIKSLIYFLSLLLLSCNVENNKNTYEITDKHLIKILEEFIEVSKQHNRQVEVITEKKIINTDIIMNFYVSNHKDTVLTFINTKPFTCENIKGLATINGYNVYLYSTLDKNFLDKKFKITKPLDSCEKHIEKRIMDVNFETSYYVRNNTFIKMAVIVEQMIK